jgi:hypothetical protein
MIFKLSTGNDFVLEPGVKVFGVFANQDDVHVLKPRLDARQVLDRAEICVEVERFAQSDVHAGRAAGYGGAHGAF